MENKSNVVLKGTYFILVILLRKCHSYTFVLFSYCYYSSSSSLFIVKYLDIILPLYFPLLFLLFLLFYLNLITDSILYPLELLYRVFFNDCFIGFLPFIVSLTTEETNCFAAGLAALNIKGNTLLAINENIPPPLLFPTER